MSRYLSEPKDGKTLVFGFDHMLGYFLQQWDESDPNKKLVDLDSKFHKLSRSKLIDFLHENLTEKDLKKFSMQINKIALDIPC